jgi:hypothetical protein
MIDLDFGAAHASFLESKGRYTEAADLYLQEGRPLYAIELLLRDSSNQIALDKATKFLLQRLWRHLSFGVEPKFDDSEQSRELKVLFRLLEQLNPKSLDAKDKREVRVSPVMHLVLRVELSYPRLMYSKPSTPPT